jgi:hypothetical protein
MFFWGFGFQLVDFSVAFLLEEQAIDQLIPMVASVMQPPFLARRVK